MPTSRMKIGCQRLEKPLFDQVIVNSPQDGIRRGLVSNACVNHEGSHFKLGFFFFSPSEAFLVFYELICMGGKGLAQSKRVDP